MRHELLNEGDIIKEGDEFLDTWYTRWTKAVHTVGNNVEKDDIYRRPILAKTKVRLDELFKIVEEHNGTAYLEPDIERRRVLLKAICTHLGIELEPEKEEWERAFDDYMIKGPRTHKDVAQAMFEAGQVCEARRGGK